MLSCDFGAILFRCVINLPVPAVSREPEEYLIRRHHLRGVVINPLQPASRRYGTGRGASPRHAVAHNGSGIAICVEVGVYAPVLAAHRAVNGSHTGQADVDQLHRVVYLDRLVNIAEQRVSRVAVLIFAAALQIDIYSGAPRIFLHDKHDLRQELVFRAVRVIPERGKDGSCAVVHDGQQPLDVRPFIDIGQHT